MGSVVSSDWLYIITPFPTPSIVQNFPHRSWTYPAFSPHSDWPDPPPTKVECKMLAQVDILSFHSVIQTTYFVDEYRWVAFLWSLGPICASPSVSHLRSEKSNDRCKSLHTARHDDHSICVERPTGYGSCHVTDIVDVISESLHVGRMIVCFVFDGCLGPFGHDQVGFDVKMAKGEK